MTTNPWIPHSGGPCPVPPETLVECKFGSFGAVDTGYASCWWWGRDDEDVAGDYHIVAYRIVKED